MSNVIEFSGNMDGMVDANATLEISKCAAVDVVIIGWDKEGEFYYNSNIDDGKAVLWLLELTKKKLLEAGDNSD